MSLRAIFKDRSFLVLTLPDGRYFERIIYSDDGLALGHTALSMDSWLLNEIGFVPQDRSWHVEAGASNGA